VKSGFGDEASVMKRYLDQMMKVTHSAVKCQDTSYLEANGLKKAKWQQVTAKQYLAYMTLKHGDKKGNLGLEWDTWIEKQDDVTISYYLTFLRHVDQVACFI
jgi:hypothetical protein